MCIYYRVVRTDMKMKKRDKSTFFQGGDHVTVIVYFVHAET